MWLKVSHTLQGWPFFKAKALHCTPSSSPASDKSLVADDELFWGVDRLKYPSNSLFLSHMNGGI